MWNDFEGTIIGTKEHKRDHGVASSFVIFADFGDKPSIISVILNKQCSRKSSYLRSSNNQNIGNDWNYKRITSSLQHSHL